MGAAEVGKFIRYKDEQGIIRYGTITKVHQRSIEIQLNAKRLFNDGKDHIVHESEIPFGFVLEVLGDEAVAVKTPKPVPAPPLPPKREKGYEKCDVRQCHKRPIAVLQYTKKGLVALCREHYGEGIVPYRFNIGIIEMEWVAPKPVEHIPVAEAQERTPLSSALEL